jgi:ABC-type transport system involved in multi-copper enzyme maturation permease subunit
MSAFWPLAREALADALRRRIAGAVLIAALLSVLMLDSCTSCAGPITVNGEVRELNELAGPAGVGTFLVLGLWLIALAGMLAADHLQSALEDGSAVLSLARPISRESFALARLAGVLGLAFAAGAIALGAAAGLLHARSGLALGPALAAALACALGCVVVAALAMAASLALPRAATILLVLGGVWLTAFANGVAAVTEVGGWLGALDRIGPPLASAMALALGPWLEGGVILDGDPIRAGARLVAWALGSLIVLAWAFRRAELRG